MEYFGKRIWNRDTKEALAELAVHPPDDGIRKKVLRNWDRTAKPLDGMGKFEAITAQIGAVLGTDEIDISKKAVIVMCADNGIVEEGVSQSGQEVTAAVVKQMAKGTSSVGRMAAAVGADVRVIDIGINSREKIPGVIDKKIRFGTRDFLKEPAMTEAEAVRAVFTGIEAVSECRRQGYRIAAAGEMGIGNTTTSSAVAAALLNCPADAVTGRGAGLSDEKLRRKRRVIAEALEKYALRPVEPLRVLQSVGGLDIAGLAGVCIGGALYRLPIVLDGVISLAAALLAERLVPGTARYLTASHKGKEPAAVKIMEELGLKAVIDADMALGEGTGAVMMLSLLDTALSIYQGRTTFSDIHVRQYERYS